ncbi:sensor histidine kinase [Acidisoma silvae]|uniref:histidine kinase n=1 Tax=Acidisoma silvae TaxID=2802396 RepID=A0A963YS24_9PROT|nr:ATP-binding protein [Acidisoma silvae]MCB8876058.1 HAMP domain-containing protein [Acidisoma silvae]
MRLVDLPRTSSFRLALVFLALFGIAASILFGFLYIRTQDYLIQSVDSWLAREAPGNYASPVPAIIARFNAHAQGDTDMDRAFTLYSADGTYLAGEALPLPNPVPRFDQPFNFRVPGGQHTRMRFRGLAHRLESGDIILVAQNMYDTREFDEDFVGTALWGSVIAAALGLLGAVIMGAGTVRRFDDVALAIQRIVGGDLSKRLPTQGTSGDLDRLGHVVNGMLDDIERLMYDVKGVCDGIAHDLRTPLTRILAGLERAQRRARTTDDYAAAIEDAIVETQGVLRTFSALLRIAEIEDGPRRAGFETVDVETIARDVVEFYEPLAEQKDLRMSFSCEGSAPYRMKGDPSLLFEAISNLVDNAIKFTPEAGFIAITVMDRAEGLTIRVADSGCGIAVADREAVQRRFHRTEKSRHMPGNGLGLSLVAAVARLHDMTVQIESLSAADDASGTIVTLLLPGHGRAQAHT